MKAVKLGEAEMGIDVAEVTELLVTHLEWIALFSSVDELVLN